MTKFALNLKDLTKLGHSLADAARIAEIDLAPCRGCGRPAHVITDWYDESRNDGHFEIECTGRRCCIYVWGDTLQEAAERWNRFMGTGAVVTKKRVLVPCGACEGKGVVVHERQTQAIRALSKRWQTTRVIAERMRISETNAANVLSALHRDGHIERRGSGSGRGGPYEWRVR